MRSEYALRLMIVMAKEYDRYLSMTEILEKAKTPFPESSQRKYSTPSGNQASWKQKEERPEDTGLHDRQRR